MLPACISCIVEYYSYFYIPDSVWLCGPLPLPPFTPLFLHLSLYTTFLFIVRFSSPFSHCTSFPSLRFSCYLVSARLKVRWAVSIQVKVMLADVCREKNKTWPDLTSPLTVSPALRKVLYQLEHGTWHNITLDYQIPLYSVMDLDTFRFWFIYWIPHMVKKKKRLNVAKCHIWMISRIHRWITVGNNIV